MKNIDQNYLTIQFNLKVHDKNGMEYQTFFEGIMERAYPDFEKIPSWSGDGGNDGWIKKLGRYYQVYAPLSPHIKDSEAAKKCKNNFLLVKEKWGHITEVKEYFFVYNDKLAGSQILLNEMIADLEKNYSGITFGILHARQLRDIFFCLSNKDKLNLGFDIDERNSIKVVNSIFEIVEIELDRENSSHALMILNNNKNIIESLNDENLLTSFEILKYRCYTKLEKIEKALDGFKSLEERYPDNPFPLLYQSELVLKKNDITLNEALLNKVKILNQTNWLYKADRIVSNIFQKNKIDIDSLVKIEIPDDKRIKSIFQRLYSKAYLATKDYEQAISYIEKAIILNPNRFDNYIAKIFIYVNKLTENTNDENLNILLDQINFIEENFNEMGDIGYRNKATFSLVKMLISFYQDNIEKVIDWSKDVIKNIKYCYFDKQINDIVVDCLRLVTLPLDEFETLINYIENYDYDSIITEDLDMIFLRHFAIHDKLFIDGREHFKKHDKTKLMEVINDIENNNDKGILNYINKNHLNGLSILSALKSFPDLRINIINQLDDNKNLNKDKLLFITYFEDDDYKRAFAILQNFNLDNLSYLECHPYLKVAQNKNAWDLELKIYQTLLKKEKNPEYLNNIRINMFNAFFNLQKYKETPVAS